MEKPRCPVCKKRVIQTTYAQVCRTCQILLNAEGTWGQYGLQRPGSQWLSEAAFVGKFNKMAAQGATISQIAEAMGLSPQSVKNRTVKLRRAGVQLEPLQFLSSRRIKPAEPLDRSKMSAKTNEHGGGKWGIGNCRCELCLTAKRAARAQWSKDHPEKVRQYRIKEYAKHRTKSAPP